MHTRRRVALAVVVATGAAATALPGPAGARVAGAPFGCRATIAGHTWLVTGRGFDCAGATAIINSLAMKKVPKTPFFPGVHGGMKCVSTTRPGRKPQFIGCADGKGKNITAIQQ